MFHEYAHIVHGHLPIAAEIRAKHIRDISDAERNLLTQLEIEADADARESVLTADDPDNVQLSRGMAVVMAHVATLLLVPRPSDLIQDLHPDVDTRLVNAIYSLSPEAVSRRDLFWTVACYGCIEFLRAHHVDAGSAPADTGEELLRRYLDILDQVKRSNAFP